jgi:hypothetical protein
MQVSAIYVALALLVGFRDRVHYPAVVRALFRS